MEPPQDTYTGRIHLIDPGFAALPASSLQDFRSG
jgi:hypothetical protein